MPKPFEEFKRINQWDLPEIINPDRICVCFEIPNERYHIRAFWTALYKLTLWNSWQTDEAHTGTKVASVWREVLNLAYGDENTMGCGCTDKPTNQRYGDDGILEVSYDGGETWQDAPELDPRFNSPLASPLSTAPGQALRCEAAGNVVGYFRAMADELIADAALWATLTGLIAAIAGIAVVLLSVASAGALTPLLLGLTAALLATGQTAFQAAMTEAVYDNYLCIVYCNTPNDGVYTVASWQAIKTQISAELTGIAATFLLDTLNAAGLVGLNNASRSGIGNEGACDTCACAPSCVSEDRIMVGNLISITNNTIVIEAVLTTLLGTTAYWVQYGSDTDDFCCLLCEQTITPHDSAGWLNCAGEHSALSPNNSMIRQTRAYRVAGTFQMTLRFADEGGCI